MRIAIKPYWLCAAVLVAGGAILFHFYPNSSGFGEGIAWFLLLAGRLHDIGRSAWWVALSFSVLIVIAILAALLTPAAFQHFVSNAPASEQALREMPLFGLILTVAMILQAAGIVAVGLIPGDRGKNKFGPPPRGLW